ncbi:MAG: protein kinase [Deltaproteobacteria bacterium]|nr:protein kinase [Deltaproteobacteria bacterium]
MIFGKYQLLELLGRGGMAEVYKAKSYGVEGFEKLLVIKRILPALTDNARFVDMFINEAKIAVSLNHANIVQVFDLGKVGDSYFIAMEFVQGMDFSTMLRMSARGGHRLSPALAAFIGSEAAKGLDYAHRRRDQNLEPLNIIHRDISPHNILLSYEGEVKITDFGIAKAKTTLDQEEPGVVKGKYAYMAPEQARDKAHDRRVDIFSLGVVLYEALAGANPLRGGQAADVLKRVESKSYPAICDTPGGRDVPSDLTDIVAKCMEPNPGKRFSDAGELYEALISFLYTTGTRVGAHMLSSYLEHLKGEHGLDAGTDKGEAHLIAAFGGGTSASASAVAVAVDDDDGDITSVQVPTSVAADESGTTSARSLAAELRDVTVLAAEIVGPAVPARVIERFRSIVQQGGGLVVEERNDLLVCLFGVEVADGRDTQDAIKTGLKLQRGALMEQTGSAPFQIGVGVHPDKIVLMAGNGPREDDTYFRAVSAARSLAKRATGWVVTSEAGRQLTSDSFNFEEVTTTGVGGADLTVCKVVGRRSVAETYGPLFGRREELRSIGEILALVKRGSGRILALVGEAGTGKTRIVHEMQRRLVHGEHEVGWYEAACVPWRNVTPFAAVAAMFRSILGVGDIEPETELRHQVERLRELGLIPEEVEAVAVLLGVGMPHDVGPEERGRQLRSALIRAASSLAADKMSIFFWDDLNYIDKESSDILHHLARSIPHVSLLLTVAFRPGLEHGWRGSPIYTEIGLTPLSESDSKRLAISRMRARKVPGDLLMDIALKSDGNPLYIEEYVKALLANGVITVRGAAVSYHQDAAISDLPKTLRGLVGARIKRLPVEQRGLLQRAAVVGQRFNAELLARVTGIDLADLRAILVGLKDVGLLTRISASEFAFSSDLVRDVVYDGIIFSDRREIHGAVAKAIEEMFGDRLDEFVERLAVHYREGGERNKAVDYLIRAGDKVATDYSHKAALDYYLKAQELLYNVSRPDLQRILSLYLPIGELCVKADLVPLGLQKMQLAEELGEEQGAKRELVQIMRITAELHARVARFMESQQYFQRAIELADEIGEPDLRCGVRATAGQVYTRIGDLKKALPFLREAVLLCGAAGNRNLQITCMSQIAKAEANSGELETALATIGEAEKLVVEATDPGTRCEFERCHAQVHYMRRDLEKSVAHSMKALEIAKEYGLRDQIAANAHNIGDDHVAMGDYKKAFTYLRFSQEVAEEIGSDILINLNNIFLAFIDALKFGSNEGLSQLEKALSLANERNTVWDQIQVHYFLGRIHFERKQYAEARTHLEHSIRIGRAADNKIYDAQAVDLLEQIDETDGGRD